MRVRVRVHVLRIVVRTVIIMNDGEAKHLIAIITAMKRGIMLTVRVGVALLAGHRTVGEILPTQILDRGQHRAGSGVRGLQEIRRDVRKVAITKGLVLIRIPRLLAVAHLTAQALSR